MTEGRRREPRAGSEARAWQSIGGLAVPVLKQVLDRDDVRLRALRARWGALAGRPLDEGLVPIRLQRGTLVVEAASPAWASAGRSELGSRLAERIRRELPELGIDRIRVEA